MGKFGESLSDPSGVGDLMTFTNGGHFTEEDWAKIQKLLGGTETGGKIIAGAFVSGDLHRPGKRAEARVERELTEFEQRKLGEWGLSAQYGEIALEV